jgi:nucleoid DNA-binding protein
MDSKTVMEKLARKLEIDREEVASLADALRDVLSERSVEMDSIAIPGFGSFEPRKRMERVAVHPSSGKRMLIPPKLLLTFRPSALLRQKIKNVP